MVDGHSWPSPSPIGRPAGGGAGSPPEVSRKLPRTCQPIVHPRAVQSHGTVMRLNTCFQAFVQALIGMIVGICGWALLQAMLDAVATLLLLLPLRLLHVLPTVHSRPKAVSAWVGWPQRQCNIGGFWWWGGLLHVCRPQWWQWPTATPTMSACVVSAMHTIKHAVVRGCGGAAPSTYDLYLGTPLNPWWGGVGPWGPNPMHPQPQRAHQG